MKSINKTIISMLLILSMVFVLTACGGNTENKVQEQDNGDIDVTTGVVDDSENQEPGVEDPIEEPEDEIVENIGEAFPGAEFMPIEDDILSKGKEEVRSLTSIEKALVSGELAGYKILISPNGYGGPMEIFTYIDTNGSIVKVEIGQHNETTGVGDQVEQPQFLNNFIGIDDDGELAGVDGVAGATFSTGGVKDGIKRALAVFENHLK